MLHGFTLVREVPYRDGYAMVLFLMSAILVALFAEEDRL